MLKPSNTTSHFMKMHGLGNDFVVLDLRGSGSGVSPSLASALADRHRGVGFDQLAVIRDGHDNTIELDFLNADGSTAGACGNATRCVARYLMRQSGQTRMEIKTERGLLQAVAIDDVLIAVNMGQPQLKWRDVPLAKEMDTLRLPLHGEPTATGMGNPHCSFFVDDVAAVPLEKLGPTIEHDPLFPARTNVQVAQVVGPDHIRVRVWERGVGVTLASGSSSCAVAVAAARRGLAGRTVRVELDGGSIDVDWRSDGVWMTGPTMHVFDGTLTPEFLESIQ